MAVPPGARPAARPWIVLGCFAVVAALLVLPTGIGLSTGMARDRAGNYPGDAEFAAKGCTICHGGGKFAPADSGARVTYDIRDAAGNPVQSDYTKNAVYTINITLTGEQEPDATNHAGFNLAASTGKFSAAPSDSNTQFSDDAMQATHKSAKATHWSVLWTAPESGPAVFTLYVNDVNGLGGNDPGDHVFRLGFWLADEAGAQAGAPAVEKEVEYGISLQQYWIGLIGLAGMIFVMVAAYVYLKYVAPHNTDEKDR